MNNAREIQMREITMRETKMRIKANVKQIFFAGLAGLMLSACEGDKSTTLQDSLSDIGTGTNVVNTTSGFNPDPTAPNLPFPINVLFSGTQDLTLNIPLAGDATDAPRVAMNVLDGFSTSATITSGAFTGDLDAASLATAVRVFEVALSTATPVAGPVVSIVTELTAGVNFVAALSGTSTIAILPLAPLKPKTSYYVVITDALRDTDGNSVGTSTPYLLTKGFLPLVDGTGASQSASLTDAQAAALEPLRIINSVSEQTAAADTSIAPSLDGSDIILSWSFTTQSVGDVLAVVRGLVQASPPTTQGFAASPANLGSGVGLSPAGAANVFQGSIDIPYYLTAATGVNDLSILSGTPWQAANALAGENNLTAINPLPLATNAALRIPIMVTLPLAGAPPYPTVIFQHGITTNRLNVLSVADSLAAAGFAAVAIDMPLHGVIPTDALAAAFLDGVNGERTFGLDIVTEDPVSGAITAVGPDGTIDSSGRHFVNLTNFVTLRDNLRQATADLFAVAAAIPTMDVDGGGADLDGSQIYFLGHSLGSIVGTPFLALESTVKDAVLAFNGGALAKLLDGSNTRGPEIAAGLAAASGGALVKGDAGAAGAAYEAFLIAAQTVVDSGDPINYGATAAANHNILAFEVVGDTVTGSPSDLVVPNRVPDGNDTFGTVASLLAGTEPLVGPASMNLTGTSTSGASGDLLVRFTAGHHGSLLTATNITGNASVLNSAAVFAEMQGEFASYFRTAAATGTPAVTIANPAVVLTQ